MTLLTRRVFRPFALSGIGLALLSTLNACETDRWVESHESGTRLSADRPECPQIWDTIPLLDTVRGDPVRYVVPAGRLAVPGPNTNVPEFHDCQRFIDSRGTGFESLYAIFASYQLDSIGRSLLLDSTSWTSSNPGVVTVSATGVVTGVSAGSANISAVPAGQQAAVATLAVTVTAQPVSDTSSTLVLRGTQLQPTQLQIGQSVAVSLAAGSPSAKAVAAAEIYTYGPGYVALGIGPGFNCLYVYFDKSGSLAAKIAPVHANDPDTPPCRDAVNPIDIGGKELLVVRVKHGLKPADYPPVARWDYDTSNRQYHIGIKCGEAWCEIGASGDADFTPSRTFAGSSAGDDDENRVLRVKGWHDQQNLAMDATDGGAVVPSGILATVVPHPLLGSYQAPDYARGQWVLTGYVGMDTTNAIADAVKSYKRKFNFDPVPIALPLSNMNTLSFCYGKRSECRVPNPPKGQGCKDIKYGVLQKPVWWVKIQAATDKSVMYRCVTRRGHGGMTGADAIAPTARWRWVAEDETVWEYCMSHTCCEVGANSFSEGWQ